MLTTKQIYIVVIMSIAILVFYNYKKELFDIVTPQGSVFFNEPIYTSGAGQRFFGTTFSSTDQGKPNNNPIPGYDYS